MATKDHNLATLIRFRGDTYPAVFTVRQKPSSVSVEGAPIDITGWAFALTINTEDNPVDATNQVASVSGVLTDATNGVVSFSIPAGLLIGDMFYDVQSTNTLGHIRTHGKGVLTITQDINKS